MKASLEAAAVALLLAALSPALAPALAPVVANAAADPTTARVSVGDRLPAIELNDQHGAAGRIDRATKLVLFTRDMDAGDVVREALAENGAERLADADAVYLSDISAMPSLVFKLFAGPKMRKRGYTMLLDRDGEMTATLPSNEGMVTALELRDLEIRAIHYAASVAELLALLTTTGPAD